MGRSGADGRADTRRLEAGGRQTDVEPELVERFRSATTHVTPKFGARTREGRLKREPIRVACKARTETQTAT